MSQTTKELLRVVALLLLPIAVKIAIFRYIAHYAEKVVSASITRDIADMYGMSVEEYRALEAETANREA